MRKLKKGGKFLKWENEENEYFFNEEEEEESQRVMKVLGNKKSVVCPLGGDVTLEK